MDNSSEKCFICGEETAQHFRNLMQLTTKYSGTLVYKVIERFLDGDLSDSAASLIASVVCQECLVKLNDYDAAYTKALIIQKEFAELLRKSLTMVGSKICLSEQMYFKEEVDGSYLDDMVELDHAVSTVDDADGYLEESKPVVMDDKVSMKCNACGMTFQSISEMQQHSHKVNPEEEEFNMEFLDDDPEGTAAYEVEFIDEERLEEEDEDKEECSEVIEAAEILSQQDTQIEDYLSEDDDGRSVVFQVELIKCLQCDVQFDCEDKLRNHQDTRHSTKGSHVCSVCGVSVKTKLALAAHMGKHKASISKERVPEKAIQGPKKANINASSSVDRVNTVKVSQGPHSCHTCGLIVKTRSALAAHVAKHSRASSFDCTFCGKHFQHKAALARHVPIHTGEKPYQCDKCGKQFIHYSSFHMHQLAHGNIREKKCEICGFMLRSSSHLKRHMRVHSGEKPFGCPQCGQRFAQRYNMMAHLKAHQGIYREYSKVYKCPFCVATFQRKLKLQEHLTREHNTVVDSGLLKPTERPKKEAEPQVEDSEIISEYEWNDHVVSTLK